MNPKRNTIPVLWLVIPCSNEKEVLPISAPLFSRKLGQLEAEGKIRAESKILFVDDGSLDTTWQIISNFALQSARFIGLRLSRPCGPQNALLAGLLEAKDACDIAITSDCDGQDNLDAMDEMIAEYQNGCEVVYGVHSDRESDTAFKRWSAETFYRILRGLGAEIIPNHADYRLMSKKILAQLVEYKESNLFLRGIVPLIGFPSTRVYYKRTERLAGKSHYSLQKMFSLACDGITGFSIKPILLISVLGVCITLCGFCGILALFAGFLTEKRIPHWLPGVSACCLVGGIQLLCTGILGEYIGKIYLETKHRPRFIVSERVGKG